MSAEKFQISGPSEYPHRHKICRRQFLYRGRRVYPQKKTVIVRFGLNKHAG